MSDSSIAASTATPQILNYFKKKFPFEEKPDQYPPFETLKEQYGKWYIFLSILVFPAIIASTAAIFFILQEIAKWWIPEFNDAIFVIETDPLSPLLPAFFLGIVATMPIMLLITRVLLGKRDDEYYYYSNWKNKSDGLKILKFLVKIIAPPALLLAVLMTDYYSALYADNIITNGFLSLSDKNYAYEDVSRIQHSEWVDEDNNKRHSYTIYFNDGYDWYLSGGFYKLNDEKLAQMLTILTEKTGMAITEEEK